jgi:hypothetical protein
MIRFHLFKIISEKLILIFLGTMIISFISCTKDLFQAENPKYVFFNNIQLKPKTSEGANTHKITDLWVYADGQLLGAFDKNKPIPIISQNDEIELNIFAGIRANGVKQSPQLYFMLDDINIAIENKKGTIDTLNAVFTYSENAKFAFIEDFEGGSIFNKDLDNDSTSSIIRSKNQPISGLYSGLMSLNKDHPFIKVTSGNSFYAIPSTGYSTFIELDYKCNIDFIVGLIGQDKTSGKEYQNDVMYINNKETWNKIYIDLTQAIQNSGLGIYKIYFSCEHEDKNSISEVYIDNVKLLYLKK